MDLAKYGFVVAGLNRKRVLKALDKPMTPTEITNKTGINLSHVSRTLSELVSHGLVECVNPDVRVGKVFKRTSDGESVVEKLE